MPIIPTRATLLSSRLGDIREWNLIVWCGCRGFPRHLSVEWLAGEHGNRATLEAVLGRLRCEKCEKPPVRAQAKCGDPFAPRVTAVVLLETKQEVARNRG